MRNHRTAKSMAKTLHAVLGAKRVSLSYGECLEIVARQLGYANWNTLAAALTARDRERPHCSFCGKSTREGRTLIEGGCARERRGVEACVFICDECISLGAEVNAQATGADGLATR